MAIVASHTLQVNVPVTTALRNIGAVDTAWRKMVGTVTSGVQVITQGVGRVNAAMSSLPGQASRAASSISQVTQAAQALGKVKVSPQISMPQVNPQQLNQSIAASLSALSSLRPPTIHLGADASGLTSALNSARSQISGFTVFVASAAANVATDILSRIGGAFERAAGQSFGAATDLQTTLNVLRTASGATAAEMQQLSQVAIQLGSDMNIPNTSAADAARAEYQLVSAGVDVTNTINATRSAVLLAASAHDDAAKAARLQAAALNIFGIASSEASSAADIFASTNVKSGQSLDDMLLALRAGASTFAQYLGPVEGAKGALLDFQAAEALMYRAGFEGQTAGTALRYAILNLIAPTDKARDEMKQLAQNIGLQGSLAYTATGQIRPFREILLNVAHAMEGMSTAERAGYMVDIFGKRSGQAMDIMLRQGVPAIDAMIKALDKEGAAADLAKSRNAGFAGSIDAIQSVIETAGIQFFTKSLDPLGNLIRKAGDELNRMPWAVWGQMAGTALDTVISKGGQLLSAFAPLGTMLQGIGSGAGAGVLVGLQTGFDWLLANAPNIVGSVNAIGGAIQAAWRPIAPLAAQVGSGIMTGLSTAFVWVSSNAPQIAAVVGSAFTRIAQGAQVAGQWLQTMGGMAQRAGVWLMGTLGPALTFVRDHLGMVAGLVGGVALAFAAWNSLSSVIGGVIGALGTLGSVAATITVVTEAVAAAGGVTAVVGGIGAALTALAPMIPIIGAITGGVILLAGTTALLAAGFITNFGGIRDAVMQAWTQSIKPGIDGMIVGFQQQLPGALATASAFWNGTLLPMLRIGAATITGVVIPVVSTLAGWFLQTLPYAFAGAVAALQPFITVSNAVVGVVNIVATVVGGLAQIVGGLFMAAWQGISSFWQGTVVPTGQILIGMLGQVGQFIGWAGNAAVNAVPQLTAIVGGFNAISNGIQTAIGWLGKFAASLGSLQLPAWLGGGTPFSGFTFGGGGTSTRTNNGMSGWKQGEIGSAELSPLEKMQRAWEAAQREAQRQINRMGFGGKGAGDKVTIPAGIIPPPPPDGNEFGGGGSDGSGGKGHKVTAEEIMKPVIDGIRMPLMDFFNGLNQRGVALDGALDKAVLAAGAFGPAVGALGIAYSRQAMAQQRLTDAQDRLKIATDRVTRAQEDLTAAQQHMKDILTPITSATSDVEKQVREDQFRTREKELVTRYSQADKKATEAEKGAKGADPNSDRARKAAEARDEADKLYRELELLRLQHEQQRQQEAAQKEVDAAQKKADDAKKEQEKAQKDVSKAQDEVNAAKDQYDALNLVISARSDENRAMTDAITKMHDLSEALGKLSKANISVPENTSGGAGSQRQDSIGSGIGMPKLPGTIKLSGARASGGPVEAGKQYLVGEHGPEIFKPTRSGTIVANSGIQFAPLSMQMPNLSGLGFSVSLADALPATPPAPIISLAGPPPIAPISLAESASTKGGGDTIVHAPVYVQGSVVTEQDIANTVEWRINATLRRNGQKT